MTRVLTAARTAPGRYRQAGDDARELADWPAAAAAYKAHLAEEPEDTAIHVQLGHALKEQGLLTEAFAAYRQATRCDGADADARLQLGRVLRLLGRTEEAVAELSQAVRLNGSEDAVRELMALQEDGLAAEVLEERDAGGAAQTVLFEIGDLFFYLDHHRTLSGIQRVVSNLLENLLALPAAQAEQHRFVISDPIGGGALSLPRDQLRRVIKLALAPPPREPEVQHARLRERIAEMIGMALPLRPVAGQTYIILGAFWANDAGLLQRVRALKTKGLRTGLYLYDLIPLNNSEFCTASLTATFATGLGDVLAGLDFILTISEYVAEEMRALLRQAGLPALPVKAVPLGHVLIPPSKVEVDRADWTDDLAPLRNRRFVLSVCTIEARKNHVYLFHAWRAMIAAGDDVPDLVLVGRPGWMIDDFMSQLRNVDYLDGRIHVLHGVTDADLATLYQSCLFTAFPSFVEGWGLPVGESLSYGTPVAASRATSIPEVGGDFVDYFDPYNLREGLAVFRRLLFEDGYLESRKARIAAHFRMRGWRDVLDDMLAAIDGVSAMAIRPAADCCPRLPAATIFFPGDYFGGSVLKEGITTYIGRPLRLIFTEGWYGCEDHGAWMRNETGLISFVTDEPDQDVMVYLRLCGAPHIAGDMVTVRSIGTSQRSLEGPLRVGLRPDETRILRLRTRTDAGGRVDLELRMDRPARHFQNDPRRFSISLKGLAWALAEDALTRTEVMERLTMDCGGR
ncbi:glycosyltransferase family 4 protein [Humitalea rosea]|uniref:glycosyltransferase family 4 protein n=1 Tax=Humitalea rosea TaxID=990373 RepID=UPI0013143C4B|nr:glycosyltransferase [Humitalea rosea]